MKILRKIFKGFFPVLQIGAGAFIIAYGWGSYHFNKHSSSYGWKIFYLALLAVAVFVIVKRIYLFLVEKYRADYFWREIVYDRFERFFLLSSLFFGLFLFRSEWQSLLYVVAVGIMIYWQTHRLLSKHHLSLAWLAAHKSWFALSFFILILEMTLQYTAYHYYILDSNIKYFNIVLFRSVAMTFFWMFLYAVLFLFTFSFKSVLRYVGMSLWTVIFLSMSFVWVINISILYYSGLYISPVALDHASGSGGVMLNTLSIILVAGWLLTATIIIFILRRWVKNETPVVYQFHKRYAFLVTLISIVAMLSLSSLKNTPERAVLSMFYERYFGKSETVELDLVLAKKLEKFGLFYNQNDFYVNERSWVYSSSSIPLLPERFAKQKPNVMIVFLESFSSRLTGVYNEKMKDVTPNINAFAADPHVTVFKKYFNASTPTITGSLAQLCSFLPPTGHEEIQNQRKLQNHHLMCLPEVLKEQGNFKEAVYVTAVNKSYAHKDGIFESMSVDKVWGTEELAKIISGEPLSWGYSDHQLFPAFFDLANQAKQPFIMMLATVDTHPPYNLPKDAVIYRDGSQPVLNMVHTTDDAFGQFWTKFKNSERYEDTILITVADHAIYPAALTKDVFPDDAGKLTYYDENFFAMYIPDSVLPKTIDVYSSGIDLTPTLLNIFGINIPNSFEGYSIFADRQKYPNVLGMHEFGLYVNQVNNQGKRSASYNIPSEIKCDGYTASSTLDLTLCDYIKFYHWKRQIFEQGRFWKKT